MTPEEQVRATDLSQTVERLREALAKATAGPWYTLDPPWLPSGVETSILARSPDPHVATFICDFDFCMMDEEDRANGRIADDPNADADLIVALRNEAPTLLSELTRLQTENAALTKRAESAEADWQAAEVRCAELEEGLSDAVATIAAVRATSRTDEWAESSEHFHAVCGRTLRRAARLVTPEADNAE